VGESGFTWRTKKTVTSEKKNGGGEAVEGGGGNKLSLFLCRFDTKGSRKYEVGKKREELQGKKKEGFGGGEVGGELRLHRKGNIKETGRAQQERLEGSP